MRVTTMRLFIVLVLGVVVMTSCVKKKKEAVEPIDTSSMMHAVTVNKTIQASAYTYLQVNEGDQEYWIAVNKMEPVPGQTYYFANSMEMKDFKSNDLDTVFASVFFVEDLSTSNEPKPAMANPHGEMGRKVVEQDETISVEPAEGGITVVSLFENKADYAGKEVLVRGKVVKVNNGIMDRNWVHIQDGTGVDGKYDLTLTTTETVTVGDVVTMQGTVAVDKDFGAGYFYDVIIESAVVK